MRIEIDGQRHPSCLGTCLSTTIAAVHPLALGRGGGVTKKEAVSKVKARLKEHIHSQKNIAQHKDATKSGHVWIAQGACKHHANNMETTPCKHFRTLATSMGNQL